MKKLLLLSLLLTSPAWGCNSFDDCMEASTYGVVYPTKNGNEVNAGWPKQNSDYQYDRERGTLRAIAYKLDEISKKLDKPSLDKKVYIMNGEIVNKLQYETGLKNPDYSGDYWLGYCDNNDDKACKEHPPKSKEIK